MYYLFLTYFQEFRHSWPFQWTINSDVKILEFLLHNPSPLHTNILTLHTSVPMPWAQISTCPDLERPTPVGKNEIITDSIWALSNRQSACLSTAVKHNSSFYTSGGVKHSGTNIFTSHEEKAERSRWAPACVKALLASLYKESTKRSVETLAEQKHQQWWHLNLTGEPTGQPGNVPLSHFFSKSVSTLP